MDTADALALVEEATFEFTLGNATEALALIERALSLDPQCFEAWHARAEICFSEKHLEEALEAARRALEVRPEDLHAHISISRIQMERGDKAAAEHHGAKARILGWKSELRGSS